MPYKIFDKQLPRRTNQVTVGGHNNYKLEKGTKVMVETNNPVQLVKLDQKHTSASALQTPKFFSSNNKVMASMSAGLLLCHASDNLVRYIQQMVWKREKKWLMLQKDIHVQETSNLCFWDVMLYFLLEVLWMGQFWLSFISNETNGSNWKRKEKLKGVKQVESRPKSIFNARSLLNLVIQRFRSLLL